MDRKTLPILLLAFTGLAGCRYHWPVVLDGDGGPDAAGTDGSTTLEAGVDAGPTPDSAVADALVPDAAPEDGAVAAVCGNGLLEPTEACDDGNLRSHDGCSSGCTDELPTWTQLNPQTDPARRAHRMVWSLAQQSIVCFGGRDFNGNPQSTTLIYAGANWTTDNPAAHPSARTDFALAYDATRDRVVFFSGTDASSNEPADTWEHDGTTWTEITTSTAPSGRRGHDMVYDEARGVVVLFGGAVSFFSNFETWEYDGTDWQLISPADSPPSRQYHALAYDAHRQRVVLFGGNASWGTGERQDTWEYDGTTWTETTGMFNPPPRASHSMVYDRARQRVVLYGGEDSSGRLDDTWEYDGTSWTAVTVATYPSDRYAFAFTYAPSHLGSLLHGGRDYQNPGASDETWVFRWLSAWPEERCDNGVDDDGDGLVSCADPDCELRSCSSGLCVGGTCQ